MFRFVLIILFILCLFQCMHDIEGKWTKQDFSSWNQHDLEAFLDIRGHACHGCQGKSSDERLQKFN